MSYSRITIALFLSCLLFTATAKTDGSDRSRGSIVVFDDFLAGGGELLAWERTNAEIMSGDAALGKGCIKIAGDPKHKDQGIAFALKPAWPKDVRVKPGDLGAYREKGAIVFYVKGKDGGESFTMTFTNAEAGKYQGKPVELIRRRIDLSLDEYVSVSREWQKVIVPLADFFDKYDSMFRGPKHFNWNDVRELCFWIGETRAEEYVYYIDELMIVPSYSHAELRRLKEEAKKARDSATAGIVIFDDAVRVGSHHLLGSGKVADPNERLVVDETEARRGKKSLQFVFNRSRLGSFASVAFFDMDLVDLSEYMKSGCLEFWVKGKHGGESFQVQFRSGQRGGSWVIGEGCSVSAYTDVNKKWQHVRIPMSDFPITRNFSWQSIDAFIVYPEGNRDVDMAWWMDDIRIMEDD